MTALQDDLDQRMMKQEYRRRMREHYRDYWADSLVTANLKLTLGMPVLLAFVIALLGAPWLLVDGWRDLRDVLGVMTTFDSFYCALVVVYSLVEHVRAWTDAVHYAGRWWNDDRWRWVQAQHHQYQEALSVIEADQQAKQLREFRKMNQTTDLDALF